MNEIITRTSIERFIEIPAGSPGAPGTQQLDAEGNSFYLIDATGEVEIQTDLSPFKTYRKSTGEEFPRDQAFRRLEFRNFGAKMTIRVWAGWGKYIDRRFEMMEATTKARGWDSATQEIPANDTIEFIPAIGDGVISRKSIIITNLDPNENLRLEDPDGNTFMSIFPRTSITLPLSDTITIANDTGAAISCNVGEINYVEGNLITTAS